MKLIRKHMYLYIVIVILPTVLATIMYRHYLEEQEINNVKEDSKEIGQLHMQYIETLIKETVKGLDVLSIMSLDVINSPDEITNLLNKTKKTDKRYEDLYFVNTNRIIVTGSKNEYNGLQIPAYFLDSCLSSKNTHVSYKENVGPDKYTLLFLCKPVLDEKEEPVGYLMAQLRIDYIKNVLELLTPNIAIVIKDSEQNVIFAINEELQKGEFDQAIPFEDVPWILELENTEQDIYINSNALLQFILFFSVVTHLIFFAVQFILLKQDADRQRKVYENQKLKMIGTLAATTAHEIKNPLTGIKGLVQLLSEKHIDSQDQMYFSVIQSEISRINDIVNEFLILGKPSAHPSDIIEIGSVVKELEPIILAESSSHDSTVKFFYNKKPFYVSCVKDQLKQVILNIAKNSFESADTHTKVSITVSSTNGSALIIVKDDGPGMSKETLQKVFEPFYTTKDTGTGLGLFVCKRILTSFGGSLSIESTENRGTTVKINVPLCKELDIIE